MFGDEVYNTKFQQALHQLKTARSYAEWQRAARKLDTLEGSVYTMPVQEELADSGAVRPSPMAQPINVRRL